jgi:hypothetical protein
VLDPAFLGVFAGSALVCASLVVTVVVAGGPAPLAAAATVHLVGVMGVTVVGSVPMNDALAAARAGPGGPSAAVDGVEPRAHRSRRGRDRRPRRGRVTRRTGSCGTLTSRPQRLCDRRRAVSW